MDNKVDISVDQLIKIEKHMSETIVRLSNIEKSQEDNKKIQEDNKWDIKEEIRSIWNALTEHQKNCPVKSQLIEHQENCPVEVEVVTLKENFEEHKKTPNPDLKSIKGQQKLQWGLIIATLSIISGFSIFLYQEVVKRILINHP